MKLLRTQLSLLVLSSITILIFLSIFSKDTSAIIWPPNGERKKDCGQPCASDDECYDYGSGGNPIECMDGVCKNPNCPNDYEHGSICYCNIGTKCGESCGYGTIGLCEDGISSCRYLKEACPDEPNDPARGIEITACYPVARETKGSKYYDPVFDATWDSNTADTKCVLRDQGNAFIRRNSPYQTNFTRAQIAALCEWCGDEIIQESRGEQCDRASDNGQPGSDCSSTCTWIYPPYNYSYYMTFGGDVYIQNGQVPQDMQESDVPSDITKHMSDQSSKLSKVRSGLASQAPRFSSNVFAISSTATLQNKASKNNARINNFVDTSTQQYTLSSNFYSYYLNKFYTSQSSLIKTITVQSSTFWPNLTGLQATVSDALGLSPNAGQTKLIANVNIPTTVTQSTITLQVRQNESPQTGFVFGQPSVLDLNAYDDWPGANPSSETIYCNGQNIYLINGNLTISTDIKNVTAESSCVFIIRGTLTIKLPDKVTNQDYRTIEGLFLANNLIIQGKDDQGSIIINGSVITANSSPTTDNLYDIRTEEVMKPQVLYVYDPRHIVIWTNELAGDINTPPIREERYLKFIEE